MFRQFISGSIVAGVLATGAASAADDSGFYVGLGLGQAHNETGHFRDLEDSVAKAFAGYAFNDYLAAEVAYVDPQKADQTIDAVRVTLDPEGVIVSTIVAAPLTESWSLFGKLGWAFYDVRQTVENDGEVEAASASEDDFAWGVGTAVKIGSRWTLRLEYEGVDVSEGKFNTTMLSGTVRF